MYYFNIIIVINIEKDSSLLLVYLLNFNSNAIAHICQQPLFSTFTHIIDAHPTITSILL